jgi:hypothetical protein
MIDVRVVDKPVDHASRGRLRALYDWVTGAPPSSHPAAPSPAAHTREDVPARIGRYAIARISKLDSKAVSDSRILRSSSTINTMWSGAIWAQRLDQGRGSMARR